MVLSKVRRRQVIFAWLGIAMAWGASSFLAFVLMAEPVPVLGATTGVALAMGVLMTRRLSNVKERRAQISVKDLRGDRLRRR